MSESREGVTRKGEAGALRRSHSALKDEPQLRCAGSLALREEEGEMANKKSGRRGSAVIALIAVLAALAGPSAAKANPSNAYASAYAYSFGVDASWADQEASWVEE